MWATMGKEKVVRMTYGSLSESKIRDFNLALNH